jgi:hypothetical protein
VPPPTTYAQAACEGWEIGVCGTNQNLPSDANIDKLVDAFIKNLALISNDIPYDTAKEIYFERTDANGKTQIDLGKLKNRCATLLLACQEYGFSSRETAWVLSTAFGEMRFAAFTDDGYNGSDMYFDDDALTEQISQDEAENSYGAGTEKGETLGNVAVGDGFNYIGRGFVQITGRTNYSILTNELMMPKYGINLIENPDLAADPKYAAEIAVYGLLHGIFGGGKGIRSEEMLDENGQLNFEIARKLINGGATPANYSYYEKYAIEFLDAINQFT